MFNDGSYELLKAIGGPYNGKDLNEAYLYTTGSDYTLMNIEIKDLDLGSRTVRAFIYSPLIPHLIPQG